MLLTIRTLSCPPPDDPQTIHAQFGVAGGRIGRSPPCTLILPDPNRHISREHAEIRFRDSAFSIKVVSKVNSVVVNEAVIAPGQAVELSDGDQILIGEYLLQAAIQPAAPGVDALFAPTVSPGLAPPSQDMFSGLAPSAATPPAALDEFFQPGVDGSRFADVLQGSPTPSAPDVFAPAPLPAAPVDHRLDQFLGLQGDPLAADPSTAVRPGSGALYRASPLDLPLQAASVPPVMPPPAPAPAPFATHDDIFTAPAGAAPASADAAQLMAVLTEALGLQPGDLDAGRPEDTVRLVGELLRKSTDGLFRMLEMRAQLKSELHIEDRTMIASRENNPLKHADTPRDAIAYLVDLRQHGNKLFMPPAKAVDDTVWDICAHEMAVMAGTRAALLASLKMFSPEVIEGRIKKTGALENVLPALHKSRLWERFLGMYNELQHEAEDHFDRLLNQEFSKAYAEQSKKLKKKR
ncbi:type VI secretion system-associated FHA domain protein TagH [Piscinibacter sakaiensis]|uniref:type VI secretion system-associated FHA domain protein TagH n=1 Tax=Piscinibacter sakaiensis TaxID=1547922 RepID=UPI00372BB3C0